MKKFSTLLFSAVAALLMASCGGNAPKGECADHCSDHLPVGLQLYSVRGDMEQDFAGTLKKV